MIDETVLLRYLDGELDEQAAAAVVEQLRHDPTLQRRAAELRAVEAAYRTLFDPDHDLPYRPRLALLERLRREPPASHYDHISREDLETLAQICSPEPLIFSLYLDLRPEGRKDQPPLPRFKNMLRLAEQRIRPDQRSHAYRESWADETEYLRDWLENEQPFQGSGLVLLSCQSIGLWRAFQLPVAVRDRLEVDDRPYLRPLAVLWRGAGWAGQDADRQQPGGEPRPAVGGVLRHTRYPREEGVFWRCALGIEVGEFEDELYDCASS